MYFYYCLFFLIVIASLTKSRLPQILIMLVLIVFVGLRYQVGSDWYNYLEIFDLISYLDLKSTLVQTDPAYKLLNFISSYYGFDIWFVNLVCALIFFICLDSFCKYTKNYWVTLLVAFPYLILAVSMGYTRQAVAIALSMIAITKVIGNNGVIFLIYILAASSFHKSALIMLIFTPYAFNYRLTPLKNSIFIVVFVTLLFLMMNRLSEEDNLYFVQIMSSSGALARMMIHLPSIAIYLLYRSKFKLIFQTKMYIFDTFVALILMFFIISFSYSTFADRFNLYFYIFDMLILSTFSLFIKQNSSYVYLFLIIIMEFSLFSIWINFSPYAECCWVPYQNYLWKTN